MGVAALIAAREGLRSEARALQEKGGMRQITPGDREFLILAPLAIGIAVYLAWCLRWGQITLRSVTSVRKKNPFGFWWDFIVLALFDALLWLVVAWGFAGALRAKISRCVTARQSRQLNSNDCSLIVGGLPPRSSVLQGGAGLSQDEKENPSLPEKPEGDVQRHLDTPPVAGGASFRPSHHASPALT